MTFLVIKNQNLKHIGLKIMVIIFLTRLFSLFSYASLDRFSLFLPLFGGAGALGAFKVGTASFFSLYLVLIPKFAFSVVWASRQSSVKWALQIRLHFESLKSDLVVCTK